MNRALVPLLTSAGLLGGYGVARATGIRWAGGVVLGAVGAGVFALVARRGGPWRASAVVVTYLGAFGGSHPLAKRLGAWRSVLAVAAATAVPAALLADVDGSCTRCGHRHTLQHVPVSAAGARPAAELRRA